MSPHSWRFVSVLMLGICSAASSRAVRVGDAPPPSPDAVRSSAQIAPPLQADDSSSLRHGVVTAITAKGDQLQIGSVWLQLTDGQTRLIRDGRAAPLSALQAGDAVSFTLAPAAAGAAPSLLPTLAVIYAR